MIRERRSRATGSTLAVGRAEDFGLEGDEDSRWVASCETHSQLVMVRTRAQAASSDGLDFCGGCRGEDDE